MIVDLFAGPGGWSEGLRMLGHREVGIEWDEAACQTARAAGHERIRADVAGLDPAEFSPVYGLIASPPCQAWSMAGKGGGRRDVEHVIACALEIAAGNDTRAEHAAKCEDARSILVVEPLRWAFALRPQWIALEQVPPVLELWTLFAQILERAGYSTWAGVLEAERYGVPQTRERAVLMARRDAQPAHPPQATHQRYVYGEPAQHAYTLDGDVPPWTTMGDALGWDRKDYRLRAGISGNGYAQSIPRGLGEPAAAITSKHRSAEWVFDRPATTIAGDARVFQPGGHHQPGEQSENAIRVTVGEAAALQSFRPDYPWQGSRSKQFEQVGNAIPPLLARAVLAELVEPVALEKAA